MRLIVRFSLLSAVVVVFGSVGALAHLTKERLMATSGVSGLVPPPPLPDPAATSRLVGVGDGESGQLVDSFAPADHYPLISWVQDTAEAGGIDHASTAGQRLHEQADGAVTEDVLLLSGWAGDPVLGIRFETVLFAACGKVVGAAPVTLDRPEIARWVHPNLSPAGWTARLAMAHMPTCEDPTLRAWAVHAGRFVYPLQGRVPLAIKGAVEGAEDEADTAQAPAAFPGAPLLQPHERPQLERASVSVGENGAVLRRCADATCEPVGTLNEGVHASAVLDRRGVWTLIVAETQAGWLETPEAAADEAGPALDAGADAEPEIVEPPEPVPGPADASSPVSGTLPPT